MTLTFTATDPPPDPSGGKYTEWQLDGGAWTQGLTCAVPAPADHSADGLHTVAYRSVDNGDNTEATRTCAVKIDTTGPTTTALAGVTVKQGKTARFRFTFTDLGPGSVALSPTATVRIVITKGSATKKTLRLGTRNAGAQLTYRWKCTLEKVPTAGRYWPPTEPAEPAGRHGQREAEGEVGRRSGRRPWSWADSTERRSACRA